MNSRARGGWESGHCFREIHVSLSYKLLCWFERPERGSQTFIFVCVKRSLFIHSLTGHTSINCYVSGFALGTESKIKKTHYLSLEEIQGRLLTT